MTDSLRDLVPEYIRSLDPYRPGKPVEEVERELRIHAVKLASNENPLGPSPLAMEAVRQALASANRYPDGGGFYLREKLAKLHGVSSEAVFLGEGSSELIDLAARILLRPGEEGLTGEVTFPLYWIAIRAAGGKLIRVPMKNYAFDLDAMARAVTPQTRVIYLANPNNPTGTVFSHEEFLEFYQRVSGSSRALIIVDEAYVDFAERDDYPRTMELAGRVPNLVVLRTFSKSHGLAGMRIGYGVGPGELFVEMNKLRTPFNTSGLAQAAAMAALDDAEHVRRSRELNRAGMQQLHKGLDELGVKYVTSHANFLFLDLGRDGKEFSSAVLRLGVIVRPMAWMGAPQAIRVSVGTAQENDKFLAALQQVLAMAAK
jgi:histidinol-phosphate aminotransferase